MTTSSPRAARSWPRRLLIAVVTAALFGFAVVAALPGLLILAASRLMPDIEVADVRLAVGRIEVSGLQTKGGGLQVDRLTVDYHLSGLFAGVIDRVAADGVRLDASFNEFAKGDRPEPFEMPALPAVDTLQLSRGAIRLDSPGGELAVTVAADLSRRQDGYEGIVQLSGDVQAALSLQLAAHGFRIRSENGLKLALDTLPAAPEAWLDAPLLVTLSGAGGRPIDWTLTRREEGWDIRGDFHAQGASRDARLTVESAFAAHLDHAGTPQRLEFPWLSIDLSGPALAPATIDARLRVRDLHWPSPAGTAVTDVHVLARHIDTPTVRAREVSLTTHGHLAIDGDRASYTLAGPGRLWVDGLVAPERVTVAGPVTAVVTSAGQPFLDLSSKGLAARGRLAGVDVPVSAAGMRGRLGLESVFFTAAVAFPVDGPAVELAVTGGTLRLDEPALALEGVSARVETGQAVSLVIEKGLLRHLADRPFVRPLTLAGSLTPSGQGWTIAGELVDSDRTVELRSAGRHDPRSGDGFARLLLEPLSFSPRTTRLTDVFPILTGQVAEASGRLAASGTIDWNATTLTPAVHVLVQDMAATFGAIGVQGLNTVLEIDGLAPLSTPPEQILAIALIEAGLPLTDGELVFRIRDGNLHIRQGTVRLAGGRMALGETVLMPASTARQPLVFQVEDVNLAEIVQLVGLDGLDATGRLAGEIPVVVVGNRILVENGRLAAEGPGRLRYRPAERPPALQGGGQSIDLMLKALDDFRYKNLVMSLAGEAGGEIEAALHIEGNNPDLYDGYPLEFNLTLSGKLDTILQDTLAGYQIPDKIRQRMLDFGSTDTGLGGTR